MELINRFFKAPKQSFFLFGPRGTGKTLWLKHLYPDSLYVDLLQPDTYRAYLGRPERFRELIKANREISTVIVDEVQKIPELLPLVHSLIEQYKNLKFILTGSSARKLKRSGSDMLAGRALYCEMHPFMASELGTKFNLTDALRFGTLPVIFSSSDKQHALNTYCKLYLNEEVQMEALVRNIGDFSRFLESMSFSHSATVNMSNIARECEVNRKTTEGYFRIIESLLLGYQLTPFTRRAKRQMVDHPKFYYFDSGVFRTFRPVGPIDAVTEVEGAALEGLIAQHIHAWISYTRKRNNMYYWRTRNGSEIDFILYGEDGLLALEVKNSKIIQPNHLRSLKSFRQDYPEALACLIYRGAEKIETDNIICLPAEKFLLQLHPENSMADILSP